MCVSAQVWCLQWEAATSIVMVKKEEIFNPVSASKFLTGSVFQNKTKIQNSAFQPTFVCNNHRKPQVEFNRLRPSSFHILMREMQTNPSTVPSSSWKCWRFCWAQLCVSVQAKGSLDRVGLWRCVAMSRKTSCEPLALWTRRRPKVWHDGRPVWLNHLVTFKTGLRTRNHLGSLQRNGKRLWGGRVVKKSEASVVERIEKCKKNKYQSFKYVGSFTHDRMTRMKG